MKRVAEDKDDKLVELSTGLMSQSDYAKLNEEVKNNTAGTDGNDTEQPKKNKKKKKIDTQGALSFGEEEGAEEAVVFKKKSNPNVKPGSLVKAAWLTKETKELIAQEAKDKQAEAEKVDTERRKRPLTIDYKITLAPIGGESVYSTGYNQSGIVRATEGLPPREFKGVKEGSLSYGTTVEDMLKCVRQFLTDKKTPAESELLLICGLPGLGNGFILAPAIDFLTVEQAKYEDGVSIFNLEKGTEQRPQSEFWVMSKEWYESTRYHFPQSSWKTYDRTNQRKNKNPLRTKSFSAVGSQDEIKQWDISQGVPEAFMYAGAVTGSGYGMGR